VLLTFQLLPPDCKSGVWGDGFTIHREHDQKPEDRSTVLLYTTRCTLEGQPQIIETGDRRIQVFERLQMTSLEKFCATARSAEIGAEKQHPRIQQSESPSASLRGPSVSNQKY